MAIIHRYKTRVQMPAKIFPHLKLKCQLFVGPTLGFDTKQRNSFLIKFGCFTIKTRYYSQSNMRKSHLNDEFLVLLGPIISWFFACANEEKISQNNKGCMHALVISLCYYPVGSLSTLPLKLRSSNRVHKTLMHYHIEALCYKPDLVTEFIKLESILSSKVPFWCQNQLTCFASKAAPPLLYLDRVFCKTRSSKPDLD